MLRYIYHALESFQSAFSRQRSWLLFSAVVLSFMAAPEMIGVTSMCRFWLWDERGYNSLVHFFRSKAYDYPKLLAVWQGFILSQKVAVEVDGRRVVLGDHPLVVKDGGRMPGVVSLRETSETQRRIFAVSVGARWVWSSVRWRGAFVCPWSCVSTRDLSTWAKRDRPPPARARIWPKGWCGWR